MRKSIAVLIAAAMLASVTAFADSAVVSGSGVNFREGPGTEYNVIATLTRGTEVTVNGLYNSSWYSVTYNGRSGYISSAYLSIQSSGSSIVSSGGSTAVQGQNGGIIIVGQSRTGTSEDTSSEATATPVPTVQPTAVPSQQNSGTIIIGGNYKYPTTTATAAPAATPTPTPTASPAATAAPSSTSSSAAASSGIRTGIISGDYVRFRTGPSTTYSIISTYNKGTELYILDVSGSWTRCTINGTTGFVSSDYVTETTVSVPAESSNIVISSSESSTTTTTDSSSTAAADTSVSTETLNSSAKAGYICGNNVRFRSGASLSSDIIGEFYFGNGVTIYGTSGDWTAVAADGKTGYVYSKYVKEGSYTAVSASSESSDDNTVSADTSSASVTGNIAGGQIIAAYACTFVGTPYKWGGTDPSTGFDCSGFVYYVYKQFGITLNRVAADQAMNGTAVDPSNLQPGDVLCFYSSGSYIGHSGIYIGDGKFVHAASSTTGVIITELAGNYTARGYVARRIV